MEKFLSPQSELNWEAIAVREECSTGGNHFNKYRNNQIQPSKYVDARLECCDHNFASN